MPREVFFPKIPRKAFFFFFTLNKRKLSEPAPHHPHGSPDTAMGANTGMLAANLQNEGGWLNQGIPTNGSWQRSWWVEQDVHREQTPQLVHGRGVGKGCRALPGAGMKRDNGMKRDQKSCRGNINIKQGEPALRMKVIFLFVPQTELSANLGNSSLLCSGKARNLTELKSWSN